MQKGFTLIELLVVIAIIAVLSGIILFSVTKYIAMGKDSNISGNMTVLIPAGEVFYNGNGNSYDGFCAPGNNSVLRNSISQMPQNPSSNCYVDDSNSADWTSTSNIAGLCCYVADESTNYQSWAACTKEFSDPTSAYCVDSRGFKDVIEYSECNQTSLSATGPMQCPTQ